MPGLTVLRPADANETVACWRLALERRGPSTLVLTRQRVPIFDDVERVCAGAPRGAYVLADADSGTPDVLLLATGSEVSIVLAARALLAERGLQARVVSMPSWEVFDEQPQAYKDEVLPPSVRTRLAVEAAVCMGWHRYVGGQGDVLGIDHFGASAPAAVLFEKFGFTPEAIAERAAALVERERA
jgi:transketolase